MKISESVIALAICLFVSMDAISNDMFPEWTVIDHSPKASKIYIGSPSICVLPDGSYIASHDEFGARSNEKNAGTTKVFRSEDKGRTWTLVSVIEGQYMSNLFYHNGALYIMGTKKTHSNFVIRRSDDLGSTWTIPDLPENGLLLEGEYHTAPVPVICWRGRIWRSLEYATAKTDNWGERYSAMVMSAPVNSDLLDRSNWRFSNHLGRRKEWLNGHFQGWLEGNIVVDTNGRILNILRVNTKKKMPEVAAVVNVSRSGRKITFDEKYIELPGAAKKFTIRYDDRTGRYISLVNPDDGTHPDVNQFRIRNKLALVSSTDLETWTFHEVLLYHPDIKTHAFQYVDWVFDGDDIIYVSRTAYDDEYGTAKSFHDANYLTFHRIRNYAEVLKNTIE